MYRSISFVPAKQHFFVIISKWVRQFKERVCEVEGAVRPGALTKFKDVKLESLLGPCQTQSQLASGLNIN